MAFTHQDALMDIVPLRVPSRRNHFTILAKARLDSNQQQQPVLLQQSTTEYGCGASRDIDDWLQILASDCNARKKSRLLHVYGALTTPMPTSITSPTAFPGSLASNTQSLDRPIYVTDFLERGSLRDCLDRGEFLSRTEPGKSDWPSKVVILKDMAKALHYIQCHMHGDQHGAISSNSVFIDKGDRGLLSWHRSKGTKREFASGTCQDWRWFSPASLVQLQQKLGEEGADPLDVLNVEADDMYSFGILAWEIATEELPFESLFSLSNIRSDEDIKKRFIKKPPHALMQVIQQCLQLDQEKRPSWCTILTLLEALDPETLDVEIETNGSDVGLAIDTLSASPSSAASVKIDDDKSKVVDMMESVLSSTFYKKELPPHLDSITSTTGKRLFGEMIVAGTAECFFSLCTSFNTQSDPAFCGVSSLSMVLNALQIDPRRQWRGVWRWYSEEHLDCCASVEEMKQKGITFNQFSCLARCHAKAIVKQADRHTLEEFRRDIQAVSQSEESHIVLSFSRAALGQTGSGHFSPIGGYHAGEDKVLVLDCARFKYPPFFATVKELWDSLLPEDPETGKCRGYFIISATEKQKQDIQRRRLQTLNGSGSPASISSSAFSSSASLPLQDLSHESSPSFGVPSSSSSGTSEEEEGCNTTECSCITLLVRNKK